MCAAETSRRAPIRVAPGERYFVDRDGEAFFWQGDTQWELFRLYEPDDGRAVMEARKAAGFNVLLVMACGVGPGDGPNVRGEAPWVSNDPGRPNEKYFRHADEMLAAARELDMLVVLGVYHQVHGDRLTVRNARTWARWIAERYADADNLIWSMYPRAEQSYVPICREVAAGLREGDGGSHMISVHPDPSPTSSSFLAGEDWVSFEMIQTCTSQHLVYPMVAGDVALTPPRPVVFAEGAYEGIQFGKLITPHMVRRQAWWATLAGAWCVYGHVGAYQNPEAWREWAAAPGASQMTILKEVVTGLPDWWRMVPDQSVFEDGVGDGVSLCAAARSPDARWVLGYLSHPREAVIRMDRAQCGDIVEVCWINPTDGARVAAGQFPRDDKPALAVPGGWDDALLLLTAQD